MLLSPPNPTNLGARWREYLWGPSVNRPLLWPALGGLNDLKRKVLNNDFWY